MVRIPGSPVSFWAVIAKKLAAKSFLAAQTPSCGGRQPCDWLNTTEQQYSQTCLLCRTSSQLTSKWQPTRCHCSMNKLGPWKQDLPQWHLVEFCPVWCGFGFVAFSCPSSFLAWMMSLFYANPVADSEVWF